MEYTDNSKNRKSRSGFASSSAPSLTSSSDCSFRVPFGNSDIITTFPEGQESNNFTEYSEIDSKFIPKKKLGRILSDSYFRLYKKYLVSIPEGEASSNPISDMYFNKYHNVSECGTYLSFAHEIDLDGVISEQGKLHNANFCKDRLCPMCAWRRSYKIFGEVSQVMEVIKDNYKFIFVTLTVPNVPKEELNSTITRLMQSWNRFVGYKDIKKINKGFFRALEVTYNHTANTFHPHFHIVFAVPLSYFSSRDYLSRDRFLELWRKAYQDDSITQVDVRVCKDTSSKEEINSSNFLASCVAEVAKYAVKSSDYLFDSNPELTDYLVEAFSVSLFHRRLASFGGIFKDVFKLLNLEDVESDSVDLIHINDKLNPSLSWLICNYSWGIGTYKLVSSRIETPDEH